MAGLIYFDIAAGKPLTQSLNGEGHASSTVDLLWRYRFDWIIIDRWTDDTVEVPAPSESEPNPLKGVEFSIDGTTYQPAEITKAVVSSDKGSLGTHRSLQLIFSEEMQGRFIRISHCANGWKYKVRAIIQPRYASSMEISKHVEIMPLPDQQMMISNPIRAAILGDSNGVMRFGWTKGLGSAGITITENVSLGSSSNAILSTRLPEIEDTGVDVLLINSTVNEYIPTRNKAYDLETSRHFVRYVQAWCAEHEILPIFVIYPQRRVLDDIAAGRPFFDQESHCVEQCEDLDIPYFNGFEIARNLAEAWNRPLPSLYLNEAHLNHATAQVVGAAIGERVWRLLKSDRNKMHRRIAERPLSHDFRVVSLGETGVALTRNGQPAELQKRQISTSLVDQAMFRIDSDAKLFIPIPDGWEMVAYTMNARRCNTSIRITGTNRVERRGDFVAYQGEEGFPFVCARTLITPVQPKEGGVTIECVPPSISQEPDEITNPTISTDPVSNPEFELSQVVIREKVRRNPYLRIGGIDLDLTNSTSIDFASSN